MTPNEIKEAARLRLEGSAGLRRDMMAAWNTQIVPPIGEAIHKAWPPLHPLKAIVEGRHADAAKEAFGRCRPHPGDTRMKTALLIGLGFYLGGAFVTFWVVGGSLRNRVFSAVFWPTFPLWPG